MTRLVFRSLRFVVASCRFCRDNPDLQTIINSMQAVEPVTLVFNNLSYSVPVAGGAKTLLNNVSGYALPGTLTALMGASGAGKTTLLDVISGRKTGGATTGEILANGVAKDNRIFPKITGYVEQSDIHDPYCTVREGLTFSARLVCEVDGFTTSRCLFGEFHCLCVSSSAWQNCCQMSSCTSSLMTCVMLSVDCVAYARSLTSLCHRS